MIAPMKLSYSVLEVQSCEECKHVDEALVNILKLSLVEALREDFFFKGPGR